MSPPAFASSASAWRHRMRFMVLLRSGCGDRAPAPRGERDAAKDERDAGDVEELDALPQEDPREDASEDGHQVHEDARDVRADLRHRAVPEDVAHERGKDR